MRTSEKERGSDGQMERKGERLNRKQDDDRGRTDQERINVSHFLNTLTGMKKKKTQSIPVTPSTPRKRASLANSHLRFFNTHTQKRVYHTMR